jgi:toxin ParE1/3/4
MSLPIVISERAERDMTLQYQWYLEHAGFDIAERYLLSVDTSIRGLAAQPDLGILRHFQSAELQDIRSTQADGSFDKHLIFYRAADTLSIERIMHGARDLPRRLTEEPGTD